MEQNPLVDIWGKERPLREFWSGGGKRILMFHDCVNALPGMLSAGIIGPDTIVVQSSSWYRDKPRINGLAGIVERLRAASPPGFSVDTHLVILANSAEEQRNLAQALPGVEVPHVNNTAFLNEVAVRPFDASLNQYVFRSFSDEKVYDAVLNSKPAPFKRHHLSAKVKNKIFISYGAEGIRASDGADPIELERFGATRIFRNLTEVGVIEQLRKTRIGMILSAEEGACYASTEYLLCGLPVVSTPSRGGRDDFYDEVTAEIVAPDPEAVEQGVERVLRRLRQGLISPADIHTRTVNRMLAFRRVLARTLERKLAGLGVTGVSLEPVFATRTLASTKLAAYRNFWIASVKELQQA